MPKIVISYRHTDTTAIAGRIYDKLRGHFGAQSVFMDVVSNTPGLDFRRQIALALRRCDVMIAVIGTKWLGERRGRPRIMEEHDFIHIEIQTAQKSEIPIIPVLIDDAEMPAPNDLPEDIREFSYAHAAEVNSGRNFHRDTDELITAIEARLRELGSDRHHDSPTVSAVKVEQVPPVKIEAATPVAVAQPVAKDQTVRHPWSRRSAVMALAGAAACSLVIGGAGVWYYPSGVFSAASDISKPVPWPKAPPAPGGGPIPTGTHIKPLATNQAAELRSVVFSRDHALMAVAGDDGFIRIWDAETFALKREINVKAMLPAPRAPGEPRVHRIAFSMESDIIYSVGFDNSVAVIDLVTGKLRSRLEPEAGSKVALFLSVSVFPRFRDKDPDKIWIAAGGDDSCFRVWHVDEPKDPKHRRYAGKDRFFSHCDVPAKVDPNVERRPIFTFSHLGRDRYAIGNEDGTIAYVGGEFDRKTIAAHTGPIFDLVFSPDSERFATAGGDGKVMVWRISDLSKPERTFGHDHPASSVAWSADGQFLASGGHDRLLRVWDVGADRPARVLNGHDKDIQGVAYHPNGKWIVSASQDGSLKVWDQTSSNALLTLVAYSDGRHVIYHRDGYYTGSPNADQYISMVTYGENGFPRPVSDADKKKKYLPPSQFSQRLRSTM